MANGVYIAKDGWHIEFILEGTQTYDSITKLARESLAVNTELKKQGKPIKTIVDISRLGKTDNNARRAGVEGLKKVKYDKLAIIAAPNIFLKKLANFVIHLSGKAKNTRYFDSRTEALKWLGSVNEKTTDQ